MRTDDLIRTLVADRDAPVPVLSRRLAWALGAGFVISAAGFAGVLGPRPDIGSAVMTLRFDLKIVVMLLLFGVAATLALRMSRPGSPAGVAGVAMVAPALVLAVAVVAELVVVPASRWSALAVGSNSAICLTAIPLMALPLLAAALVALRDGAPTRPGLTGAVAGLVAGSLAASLYAIHCTDDSPLFVAIWYGLALAIVTLLGAAGGRFWLRW